MKFMSLLHFGYSIITFLFSFPLAGVLFFSTRGRIKLHQRFGLWNIKPGSLGKSVVWVHAASLGESRGVVAIVERLKRQHKNIFVVATATSETGRIALEKVVDAAYLLPFDSIFWFKISIKKYKPILFVCSETEIWPAALHFVQSAQIKTIFLNARINSKTFSRYLYFKAFLSPLLGWVSKLAACSSADAERFSQLGVVNVSVAGNTKYDFAATNLSTSQRSQMYQGFFGSAQAENVFVLGSLRPGEEKFWFPALAKFLQTNPKLKIIIAPRHQEKFQYFSNALKEHQIIFTNASTNEASKSVQVVLLDTIGDLFNVYSLAKAAFVGGTLENFGGHNPLEPACYAAAPIVGPYYTSVVDIVEQLKSAQGCLAVNSQTNFFELLLEIEQQPQKFSQIGINAKQVWQAQTGAIDRCLEIIEDCLDQRSRQLTAESPEEIGHA